LLFDKIADLVTRHYKAIIAFWIVALLISVPALLRLGSAVNYSTDMGGGVEYESTRASEIISDNFSTSVANSTMIIVIQGDDVTDQATKDFVLALEDRIRGDDRIQYMDGVTSLFDAYYQVIDGTVQKVGPGMHSGADQMTAGVDALASTVYGIPLQHVEAWSAAFSAPGATPAQADAAAYAAVMSGFASQDMSDPNVQMAYGYYQAFAAVWNATSNGDGPYARASSSIDYALPAFVDGIPDSSMSQENKTFMKSLPGMVSFDQYRAGGSDAVKAYSRSYVIAQTAAASGIGQDVLSRIYDLKDYSEASVRELAVSGDLDAFAKAALGGLSSNFVSADGKTMLVMVMFNKTADYVEGEGDKPVLDDVAFVREDIQAVKGEQGSKLSTWVTGEAAISNDMMESSESDMSRIEPITIIIVLLLMGVLFRSVLGQFLPLGAVGVAIGISEALVFVIGTTIAQVDSTVTTMLFAILMGVGTDYSIFIVTRYREERIRGATKEAAVHSSVAWAGEAIVTSGATVIIAFLAMTMSTFTFVQMMGLILGLAIVVALLVALTLVPAVLMIVGNNVFWPTTGARFDRYAKKLMDKKSAGRHNYFHKAASFSVNHAKTVLLIAILISVPTTYVYLTQETSFDFIGAMGNPESIEGMNAMTDGFGAGRIMPTEVVVISDKTIDLTDAAYLSALAALSDRLAGNDNIQEVTGITRPYGTPLDLANLSDSDKQAMSGFIGSDGRTTYLTVILKEQPQKASSVAFMPELRDEIQEIKEANDGLKGSEILLGGSTAQLYDSSVDTSEQFRNIEIVVVIGIFIVLMIVLGSILLPLFAVLSIAMSISWAFALTSLVFGAWMSVPILWIIPLILFVMLMGIGMDYNVFILTRIREEVHKGKDTRTGVVDAVDWTGGIITALALIMAGAFGSMMLSSNAMLQEFGFALFVAVLIDAMVVRTYIVPAAITLMGDWAWWAPGILQREGRRERREERTAQRVCRDEAGGHAHDPAEDVPKPRIVASEEPEQDPGRPAKGKKARRGKRRQR